MTNSTMHDQMNIVVDVFEGRVRSVKTDKNLPINISIREALRDRTPVYSRKEVEIDIRGVDEARKALRKIVINTVPMGKSAWGIMEFKKYARITFHRDGADLVVVGKYPLSMKKEDDVQRVPLDDGFFTNPGNIVRCKQDSNAFTVWVATQGYSKARSFEVAHGTTLSLMGNGKLETGTRSYKRTRYADCTLNINEINVLNSVRDISNTFIATTTFVKQARHYSMLTSRQVYGIMGPLTRKGCITPGRVGGCKGFYVTSKGTKLIESINPRLRYAA